MTWRLGSAFDANDAKALLTTGLQDGGANVPYWLLKYYPRLRLTEQEVMLLIQIMAFKQKEQKDFPTPEELHSRMSIPMDGMLKALQRMIQEGLLRIDEIHDPNSGVHSEVYNWTPLLERLAEIKLGELEEERAAARKSSPGGGRGEPKDIFSIFEKEFGRPLTPMELESITGWLDKDKHPEELILAGLKEAVFAGKVHFRYIDRILLEWQRNRITSVEQAKEHSQKFRSR